jgi:hypothetical protein
MVTGELELATRQMQFAREYTKSLLEDVGTDEWYLSPPGIASHLAWQVGHLAMAEYGLTLLRIRGKLPEDANLISNDFIRSFKRGSEPVADATQYPAVEQILAVFDRVHSAALEALSQYQEADLQETLPMPYAVHPNKLGSILFCSVHEMLHAGQIGLLRRLLGKSPIR